MAEMERFELSRAFKAPTAFRVRTLQPLGYISEYKIVRLRAAGNAFRRTSLYRALIMPHFFLFCKRKAPPWPQRKSQAKNAVLFQQTILRYFVHFGQHEKATRQSPAGSLCFIVLFLCYFRVLCVRFSLKYERTGAARPPPPSTRPAPCSHSARLKPSLGSCSSRFGFARSPPVIPRRASSLSGATAE